MMPKRFTLFARGSQLRANELQDGQPIFCSKLRIQHSISNIDWR
jgi:hypothetical protein